MATESHGLPWSLEEQRPYLKLLARLSLRMQLRRKMDSSDLVQDTMAAALAHADQFRGQTKEDFCAWLRGILQGQLKEVVRKFLLTQKRNLGAERSLEDALANASNRLESWLAAEQSSPSEVAERNEQLFRLAQALEKLPEDQQLAFELKHLLGWSVADMAREMERSEASVAGLLRRGLAQLRQHFGVGGQASGK